MKKGEMQLTRAQRESVEYDAGDLLVKGVPGSGKSVVLLERALRFNRKAIQRGKTEKILILTYANSLVKYTGELVDLTGLTPRMIELSTISKLCLALYRRVSGKRFVTLITKASQREELVDLAVQRHLERTRVKHRFHDVEAAFWADEFLWIKQKNIRTAEEYTAAERTGRGGKVRLAREDRAVAFALFREYCGLLAERGLHDWEDIYTFLIGHAERIPDACRYDHILVDEAQDLSYAQLRTAKLLSRQTVTIAADKAQKIYSTTFSWRELGIDIRGRASKALKQTFRSTRQIVQLAESLLEFDRVRRGDQSEYTEPVLPEREGMLPQVISCATGMDERDLVVDLVRRHTRQEDVVGILYRSYREESVIEKWLREAEIPYEKIAKDGDWSLARPGAKLSTLHSAKGLEFDTIVIPSFTRESLPLRLMLEGADPEQLEEIVMKERSLLYVGMTRARYELYLVFSGQPSPYLREFEPAFYDYLSNGGTPLEKPERLPIPGAAPGPQAAPGAPGAEEGDGGDAIRSGSVVKVHTVSGQIRKYLIDTRRFPLHAAFLGRRAGDTVTLGRETLVVDEIR